MNEVEEKINFKKIDQLHNATLNFSKASIQMKQMMITLAAIVAPIIVKLSADKLNLALFISMYLIIIVFHSLDGFTYYYQKKLREMMNYHFNLIQGQTNPPKTLSKWEKVKIIIKSVFNSSTLIYPFLALINTIGLFLYLFGIIK